MGLGWLKRVRLFTKISATALGVILLAIASAAFTIRSSSQMNQLMERTVTHNVADAQAAMQLEVLLLRQSGFLSAFLLSKGETKWIEEQNQLEPIFERWLKEERRDAESDEERRVLGEVAQVFSEYDRKRDEVVALAGQKKSEEAWTVYLTQVIPAYNRALRLCRQHVEVSNELIGKAVEEVRKQGRDIKTFAIVSESMIILCATVLAGLYIFEVWLPVRRMLAETRDARRKGRESAEESDDLRAVGRQLRMLMSDMEEMRQDLEQSQRRLTSAEKLAAIGKLAAGVAHEIRNPMTAMKLWLYSAREALEDRPEQRRKLDIVSEEMSRLDRIVRHFLEFAKPPALRLAPCEAGALLDRAFGLFEHPMRLKAIELKRRVAPQLPSILADGEQLQQVIINLIGNAVDALEKTPGSIEAIAESIEDHSGEWIVIRIRDSGPGIAPEHQERIFEPFFTTKEEGTGLGLGIAARIMIEHGGRLALDATGSGGTTFSVWLPVERAMANA